MPITVKWDDAAHTIILLDFSEPWTWEDYEAIRQEANAILEGIAHPVAMIVDFHDSSFVPQDVLPHAHHALDTTPKNLNLFVLVGANPHFQRVYSVLARVYRVLVAKFTVVFVDSREAARKHLSEARSDDMV